MNKIRFSVFFFAVRCLNVIFDKLFSKIICTSHIEI
nr:MAG TPA: hypothetical protein [Crassvirales sp.]